MYAVSLFTPCGVYVCDCVCVCVRVCPVVTEYHDTVPQIHFPVPEHVRSLVLFGVNIINRTRSHLDPESPDYSVIALTAISTQALGFSLIGTPGI